VKWSQTIAFGQPLRGVALLGAGSPESRERLDASQIKREQSAYDRGLAEGERRLSEQLLRQRAELLELQNGILAGLRAAVPQVVRQSESTLIELAIEVAQKLVAGLPVSTEMVEAAVRSALAQAEQSTEFDISLHPDDLGLLKRSNSPVLLPGPGNEAVRFHNSSEVTRGGCLVQTRFGVIDARRETKLELIRQSLDS
jgi:flagellar assembly protein FliH